MISLNRTKAVGTALAMGAGICLAVPVFACTEAPSINVSSMTMPTGSDVLVIGAAWAPHVPVVVHWDGLSGPVLATVMPHANGIVDATRIHIPAGAAPGYHYLVATDNALGGIARTAFQVTGRGAAGAPPPQAILASPSTAPEPSGVGGGVIAMLAALGASGAGISTAGAVALARSRRTVTVAKVTRRPHSR